MKKISFRTLSGPVALALGVITLLAGATALGAEDWPPAIPRLVDSKATPQTRAMYLHLQQAVKAGRILIGHQNSTLFGVGWRGDAQRSDFKAACGKMPAVYGWDMNTRGKVLSADGEDLLPLRIREAYDRGGISTLSMHLGNPVTGRNFYDTTPAVPAIIPGGEKHQAYRDELDRFASFVGSLRGSDGALIPFIFRPFHEHNKSWFWWGRGNCTPEEFVALWRFTVTYLRDQKGLHNLLYAYSPDSLPGNRKADYLWGYPGDDFVDVLGYDHYCQDVAEALSGLRIIVALAEERGKLPAFTETGVPDGLAKARPGKYFTERLLKPLKEDASARRVAYVMLWQNRVSERYWVPLEGDPLLPDFRAFVADPAIALEEDLPHLFAPPDQARMPAATRPSAN